VDNFQRNSLPYENLSLLAPYTYVYAGDILVSLVGWCPGSCPPGLPLRLTPFPLHYKWHQLMLFKEIIIVYCQN